MKIDNKITTKLMAAFIVSLCSSIVAGTWQTDANSSMTNSSSTTSDKSGNTFIRGAAVTTNITTWTPTLDTVVDFTGATATTTLASDGITIPSGKKLTFKGNGGHSGSLQSITTVPDIAVYLNVGDLDIRNAKLILHSATLVCTNLFSNSSSIIDVAEGSNCLMCEDTSDALTSDKILNGKINLATNTTLSLYKINISGTEVKAASGVSLKIHTLGPVIIGF